SSCLLFHFGVTPHIYLYTLFNTKDCVSQNVQFQIRYCTNSKFTQTSTKGDKCDNDEFPKEGINTAKPDFFKHWIFHNTATSASLDPDTTLLNSSSNVPNPVIIAIITVVLFLLVVICCYHMHTRKKVLSFPYFPGLWVTSENKHQ